MKTSDESLKIKTKQADIWPVRFNVKIGKKIMITSNFETLSKLTQSKLHYNVSNSSGSVFKNFGKDKKAAYDFAASMNETAIIRGFFIFKKRGEWQGNTVFIDHIFK